jgi:UDPglucose--hexose-1-phosphate uridylyltransferase
MAIGEFRKDLVSGHWVLISTERAKRKPKDPETRLQQPKDKCPFEDPIAANGKEPIIVFSHGQRVQSPKDWTTLVIPNKYPALTPGVCGPTTKQGPFEVAAAHGFHELVITRNHDKSFAHFTKEETKEVLQVYRDRYREIAQDNCGAYVSIFHNHGKSAGASIYHNHSQIISTPILPPHVMESLRGSGRYFKEHGKKVHGVLIDWEITQGKRVVYENEKFICIAPFASQSPYEVRIFPKADSSYFEKTSDGDLGNLADALATILRKMYVLLDDPDYNFFIHTSPVKKEGGIAYEDYRWHIEIVPRLGIAAGFEFATAIYINSVDPDQAAAELRATPTHV